MYSNHNSEFIPNYTSYEQLLRVLSNRTTLPSKVSDQVYYFSLLDELRVLEAQQKRRASGEKGKNW